MPRIPAVAFGIMLTALSACGDDGPGGSGPAETGSLELTTVSTGDDLDGNGYAIEVDGEEVGTVETNGAATVAEVTAWSPDGSRIAFASDRNGDQEIFVMNADGTGAVNLTSSPGSEEVYPAWTPDGQRILFATARDGDAEIYIMNADGSDQTNLTNDPDSDITPSVSPDGRVLFLTNRTGDGEIFAMNLDGSSPVNLTNSPGSEEQVPSWSSDGSRIAFASDRTVDIELFVANADGSSPQNLSNNAALIDAPGTAAWGP